MKYKEVKNENYCAIVVEIKTLIPLENCDNVVHAVIMGNRVVVSNSTKVGDVGIYFPLETALSKEYLKVNNLYRDKTLNDDQNKSGYFEENGRIRCVKFRSIHKSEGLFMPIESIAEFIEKGDVVKIDDVFDELNGTEICKKYVIKESKQPGTPGSKKSKTAKISKLVEGQFRFHQDTSMLYRNLHMIKPDTLIQISYKVHGTSCISSNIICKKPLTWYERILKKFKVNIVDTKYDNIYASRKVVKNSDLNPNAEHFYDVDIWGLANDKIKEFLQDGMTMYYEIVGYMPSGAGIQGEFDYGCGKKEFKIYVYRITYTNPKGKVFEFSAKQVQDYCKMNGLEPVIELYYGYAKDLLIETYDERDFGDKFLDRVKELYNEKDCFVCKNKVPEEGCIIRVEGVDFQAYKAKSNAFYAYETKQLDKGKSNIEDEC